LPLLQGNRFAVIPQQREQNPPTDDDQPEQTEENAKGDCRALSSRTRRPPTGLHAIRGVQAALPSGCASPAVSAHRHLRFRPVHYHTELERHRAAAPHIRPLSAPGRYPVRSASGHFGGNVSMRTLRCTTDANRPRSTEQGPAAARRSCSRRRPRAGPRPREDLHADLVGFGGPGWSRHLTETSPSRKRVASAPGHLQSPVAFRHCLDHPLSLVQPDCHTQHQIRKRIPI